MDNESDPKFSYMRCCLQLILPIRHIRLVPSHNDSYCSTHTLGYDEDPSSTSLLCRIKLGFKVLFFKVIPEFNWGCDRFQSLIPKASLCHPSNWVECLVWVPPRPFRLSRVAPKVRNRCYELKKGWRSVRVQARWKANLSQRQTKSSPPVADQN